MKITQEVVDKYKAQIEQENLNVQAGALRLEGAMRMLLSIEEDLKKPEPNTQQAKTKTVPPLNEVMKNAKVVQLPKQENSNGK